QQLAARIGSREGQLWVNAMIIHKATGGNLTVVADSLGKRLRERLDLSREVRALTAQARLSGIVVAAVPLLFLVILSASAPQMKVLYETPAGWGLLTAGLLLELVGFAWIKSALRVKA
ncbi:MAG: type II secretion system F family protein, partial [Actinomycetota bacterium]